jgi:hypothetical protein
VKNHPVSQEKHTIVFWQSQGSLEYFERRNKNGLAFFAFLCSSQTGSPRWEEAEKTRFFIDEIGIV